FETKAAYARRARNAPSLRRESVLMLIGPLRFGQPRAPQADPRLPQAFKTSSLQALKPSSPSQKQLIRGVRAFARVAIAERFEERVELRHLGRRDFEAGEHAAEVGAVIAVVEQADVPAT